MESNFLRIMERFKLKSKKNGFELIVVAMNINQDNDILILDEDGEAQALEMSTFKEMVLGGVNGASPTHDVVV